MTVEIADPRGQRFEAVEMPVDTGDHVHGDELTRMINAKYVEPMRERDAEGRVTGLTGQTLPTPARGKGANLHPSADMLPDAVSEIKRLRGMLLDLGVDPNE